ncbi:bifunctional phosphoribosyl-AMP cyclohydrolase/phosphoribosyl-ATP diphosphatase HisIE [Sediminibacillus massiliensis]|uniref:bifunctional phosphoribosyl-AMP cyclohydrolase/phosphoribosyl-ATP diphosphatase HisIE n=1 Tax=Sediminibacillus massiliensis TaxID=1926277 RepID=UPI00098862E3|nr:bifunctional phosphoribosyl-AMP cyclohydrolase/phosphoribosyl-ATP diphosphatase HisIE [Sediminibacillus massiliensis]
MKMDFSKGLVPAVVVNDQTEQVLMVAYMNEEAYQKTIETKQTWFYSRSRKELWHKGATSGNVQTVKSMKADCDGDTLLIRVAPAGPACHTGKETCFFYDVAEDGELRETEYSSNDKLNIFEALMDEVEARKTTRLENSYTNYLFDKGIDKIGKKVIEEAGEVVIAAKNQDKQEIVNEISDLIYHSFVLMADQDVALKEVMNELNKRTARKGNSKGDRPVIEKW